VSSDLAQSLLGLLTVTVLLLLRWAVGVERRISRLEGRLEPIDRDE